jgi:hypothetical protein
MLTRILDFLRKDPTRDWPTTSPRHLLSDVEKASLNDVAFGAPLDSLRVFGRPHNRNWRSSSQCAYPPLGIEIAVDMNDAVHFFACYFRPSGSVTDVELTRNFAPCSLDLKLHSGDVQRITPDSSAAELRRDLRLTREESDGDTIWSVVLGKTWLGFGFDSADKLETLDIEPAPPEEVAVVFR